MMLHAQDDPLPSWNEGSAKQSILDVVTQTNTQGGADFVAPEDRIASFDPDRTLWVEHPPEGDARAPIPTGIEEGEGWTQTEELDVNNLRT
jgi:hypothetical protein